MNGEWLVYLIGFMAGVALPVQVAFNSGLRMQMGQPMLATLISFSIGTLVTLVYCLIRQVPLPTMPMVHQTSWWMWCGGALGVFYVWSTIYVTPKLGTALTLVLIVAGQMVTSVLLDYFGAFGLKERPISWQMIVGLGLIFVGVLVLVNAPK